MDANTLLQVEEPLFFDWTIHGRDDRNAIFLMDLPEGGMDGSQKLMRYDRRDGTFGNMQSFLWKNLYSLIEEKVCEV